MSISIHESNVKVLHSYPEVVAFCHDHDLFHHVTGYRRLQPVPQMQTCHCDCVTFSVVSLHILGLV